MSADRRYDGELAARISDTVVPGARAHERPRPNEGTDHARPDLAVEVFVLEPLPPAAP
jgi:hypothetical protein